MDVPVSVQRSARGGLILPYQGKLPQIATDAFIAANATVIGDVEIGAGSGIWFGCVLRGDVHSIRIGRMTNIQDGTVIHVSSGKAGTSVGDGVTVGHMAVLHACTLEDDSFVGMKACVMDFAVVESGAMVAAGALVAPGKRVRRGELWAGSPARLMRQLSEEEMAYFKTSAEHYAELARSYA